MHHCRPLACHACQLHRWAFSAQQLSWQMNTISGIIRWGCACLFLTRQLRSWLGAWVTSCDARLHRYNNTGMATTTASFLQLLWPFTPWHISICKFTSKHPSSCGLEVLCIVIPCGKCWSISKLKLLKLKSLEFGCLLTEKCERAFHTSQQCNAHWFRRQNAHKITATCTLWLGSICGRFAWSRLH
jgi:hypothetical protein